MHSKTSHFRSGVFALLLLSSLAAVSTLTGCGIGHISPVTSAPQTVARLHGLARGGQQPISGSRVYLYAAGTNGYNSASISLINRAAAGVKTDGNGIGYVPTDGYGNFNLADATGKPVYKCPSGDAQAYILIAGGNPGLAPGTDNEAIQIMSVLGSCSSLGPDTYIFVDEVSTVSAVTALQQFMNDPVHVGSSQTNTSGIARAFSSVQNLVGETTGAALATSVLGNGIAPQAKLNTIADILAPCVSSAGPGSTDCSTLFAQATPPGGTQPGTVASAALQLAKFPGNNVTALYGLVKPNPPFTPYMQVQPNDFTLGVTFTGGGLKNPGAIVIDSGGSAWTTNCPNCIPGGSGTDSVVGFGPQGSLLAGDTGYTSGVHLPQGIAFDTSGNLWLTNLATGVLPDSIQQFDINGVPKPNFPFTDANLSTPLGIALDNYDNAWVTNQSPLVPVAGNLLKITASGVRAQGPVSVTGFMAPTGVVIDSNGFVYATGYSSNNVLKTDSNGNQVGGLLGAGSGLAGPLGLSLDYNGNLWSVNSSDAVSEIGPGNVPLSNVTGYTPIGLLQGAIISVDGLGTAWIANCRVNCPASTSLLADNIIHLSATGVPITISDGFQNDNFNRVGATAIDPSGNLWITNNGGGSVTELLGVAAPVRTPIVAANGQLGGRP